jgi:hypothetical protein
MREVGGKMATNYWLKLKDDNESIATWLKDFLRYRREIVQTWAPDIEPAVPFLLSAQRVYAIHDSAGWLALRYYKDQGTVDRVEVRQASRESPSYGRKGNTIDFKQFFVDLPPETDLIQERSSWSSKSGRAHRNWPHPFLEAASEVRKLINDYNSSVPRIFLDALDLTDSRLSHFTSSEIQMMRELSKRFPEISELFTQYQTKVQVVHIVHLHEYRDNWIRDGALSSYFFHADTDEVHVIRIDEATHVIKFDEILARLGLSEQDAFRQQRSSILYYLREIAGLN